MKVCVFGTRGFPYIQGGVEKHCECLYPLIAADGQWDVVVFRRKPYVSKRSLQHYDGIRFIDLPSTRYKGFEAMIHSFLATICCLWIRPDIVHIHNIGPALFSPLLRFARIKVVLTYHSPNYEHEKWDFFSRNLLKLSEKFSLWAASAIIFVNDLQRRKFNGKISGKSCFIPNGIQPPVFDYDEDYLHSIGVEKNKYVLAVGRITPEKGFDYLIKAFKSADIHGFKLVIAGGVEGEQSYYESLKSEAGADKVVFTGYINGKPLAQLFTNAALFVQSSYNEGMSIVMLEAMSYGLPMQASDIPPNKALSLPEKNYFKAGDEQELTQRLQQSLTAGEGRISYQNLEAYDWKKIAAQTLLQAYQTALES